MAAFCVDELIELSTHGQHHILEFRFDEEGGGDWVEGEGQLAGLIRLRNDILEGDYRCLYLAWLKATFLQDPDELAEIEEPPVPAGLHKLTPALQRFAEFFDIDHH